MSRWISLIALLLTACTPTLAYLQVDPGFTASVVKQQKLYIAPVINTTGDKGFDGTGYLLETAVREERETFRLGTAADVLEKVGKTAAYEKARAAYKKQRAIAAATIKVLGQSMGEGYIVFSRLSKRHDRKSESRKKEEKKDSKGKVTGKVTKITKRVTSRLKGAVTVYNLRSGRIAFDAIHNVTASAENVYEIRENLMSAVIEVAMAASEGSGNRPYPSAVGAEILGNRLYNAIAKNLPEED